MFCRKPKQEKWTPTKEEESENVKRLSGLLKLRSEHHQAVAKTGWDSYQKELHNTQMLKGLFKKMDPTVMKPIGDVKGEIQLSFKYESNNEMLLIKVINCRDLANRDLRAKMSNFFVKMELLPDALNQGERQTQVCRGTNSPTYDEIFGYCVPESVLDEGRMIFHVCEHSLGGEDDVRGEVIVDLATLNFQEKAIHTAWYPLNMETDLSVSGDLDISIAFQHPKTLLITVHGANNLSPRDEGGSADPFVKVAVPGCNQIFQTQVLKGTLNPNWLETFEFTVYEEEFEDKYVVFHVVDKDNSSSNDSLGQCIVELKDLNPEFGLHGNFELADLRNSDRLRAKIYQNNMAQEFRESLAAHSVARNPLCLYKKHKGGKLVTVTCRKAGAQGKIKIVDGIPMY